MRLDRILLVAGAITLVLGCGDDGGSGVSGTVSAWKSAGLEPTKFEKDDGAKLDATACHRGKVSGIYATLCEYKDAKAATAAKAKGLKSVGNRTGISLSRNSWLLVAVDRDKVDPSGRTMNKLATAFWKK